MSRIAAILFSVGYDGMVATVVEGAQVATVALGSTLETVERVALLREELANTTSAAGGLLPELRAFAEDWGRSLVPADVLSDPPDVLIVIPQGLLHDLPFHAVAADDGTPLGCRTGVVYASSASLFVRCCKRGREHRAREGERPPFRGGGTDVLEFDEDDTAFGAIADSVAARMNGSAVDAGTFGFGRVWLKPSAFADGPPRVLCAVAHGWIDPQNHALSGLLVDPEPGVGTRARRLYGRYVTFRDLPLRSVPPDIRLARDAELLTTLELELEPELSVELTMLLACSAGSGRLVLGDQPASLAESFLRLGSASVIAPMWDSRVDTTRAWIARFTEAWLDEHQPKALAAREGWRAVAGDPPAPDRLGPLHLRGDWR